MISNGRYAITDSNTCQAVARRECRTSNRSYAITDFHTCQAVARSECITSNRSYAIRDIHTCKAAAIFECILSNRSYVAIKGNNAYAIIICIRYNVSTKNISSIWLYNIVIE